MSSIAIAKLEEKIVEAKQDPVYFAELFLSIKAFPYQEEFLRDSARDIAAACGRQVGKTTLAAIKGLHFAFFNAGVTVLIVSATLRQSMILFAKVRSMIESSPLLRLKLKSSSRTTIEFDHGSRIVALPCGPTGYSLRGHTADMVIIDEANFVPEGVVDGVIRPMLITRPNSRLVMLSTPWTLNHPFYRAISQKELGFHVYSWPTRLNPLVLPEKLEAERSRVDELTFLREFEAQFVEETNSYFPRNLILQCVDGEHELLKDQEVLHGKFDGIFHLGIDFGKRVDYTVIAVLQRLENRCLQLDYLKQLPLRTTYASVTGWARHLKEAFEFSSVTFDQTGVGEAPAEDLKAFFRKAEGVILTSKTKLDILSNLLLIMEHGRLILPLDRTLIAQINGEQYEMAKNGELLFSHPPRSHDDQLWALSLAAWGARTRRYNFRPITQAF